MYPSVLQDRGVGGQIVGRGYDSVFQQIENRIENTNRGKRPATGAQDARQNVKATRYSLYGCLNWQPMLSAVSTRTSARRSSFWSRRGGKRQERSTSQWPRDIWQISTANCRTSSTLSLPGTLQLSRRSGRCSLRGRFLCSLYSWKECQSKNFCCYISKRCSLIWHNVTTGTAHDWQLAADICVRNCCSFNVLYFLKFITVVIYELFLIS